MFRIRITHYYFYPNHNQHRASTHDMYSEIDKGFNYLLMNRWYRYAKVVTALYYAQMDENTSTQHCNTYLQQYSEIAQRFKRKIH